MNIGNYLSNSPLAEHLSGVVLEPKPIMLQLYDNNGSPIPHAVGSMFWAKIADSVFFTMPKGIGFIDLNLYFDRSINFELIRQCHICRSPSNKS